MQIIFKKRKKINFTTNTNKLILYIPSDNTKYTKIANGCELFIIVCIIFLRSSIFNTLLFILRFSKFHKNQTWEYDNKASKQVLLILFYHSPFQMSRYLYMVADSIFLYHQQKKNLKSIFYYTLRGEWRNHSFFGWLSNHIQPPQKEYTLPRNILQMRLMFEHSVVFVSMLRGIVLLFYCPVYRALSSASQQLNLNIK